MRITTRIVSWGKSWKPIFPRIDLDSCYPKNANGESSFDEADFCRQVRNNPMIQMSSCDRGSPCAFGAILIASVNDWLDDNDVDHSDSRARKIHACMNRRMDSGNYSFCRIDISGVNVQHNGGKVRGVRVNITTRQNDAVEEMAYEHDFAMIVADFCKCYSAMYERRGEPALVLTESTRKLIDELESISEECERKESNARRRTCERNMNGMCSPCKFDCRHYSNGSCVEA